MLRGRVKKQTSGADVRRRSMTLGKDKDGVPPVASPRATELEVPMNLALGDLKDCAEKETVMVIWGELSKQFQTCRSEAMQFRELYDAECTKRSQQELLVQELRQASERDARVIETQKKEMKKLFDLATSCASGDDVGKLRRRYEDALEAELAAGRSDADVSSKNLPKARPLGPAASQPALRKPNMGGKPKKQKEKDKQHDAAVRLVNDALNPRLERTADEFCDPRRNYTKLFLDPESDILVDYVDQSSSSSRSKVARKERTPPTKAPSQPQQQQQQQRGLSRKGAATLRSQIVMGRVDSSRDDDDDDEEEDEEDDDDSTSQDASPMVVLAPRQSKRSPLPETMRMSPRPEEPEEEPALEEEEEVVSSSLTADGFAGLQVRKARTRASPMARRARSNSVVDMYEEGYESRLETMLIALKSKGDGRNQRIVTELLSTEEDYLHDLGVIMETYGKALKPLLSEQEYSLIFCNVDELNNVHIALLADLKSQSFKSMSEQDWGAPFLRHAAKLRAAYDTYTANQADGRKVRAAVERSQPQVAEVLVQVGEKPECRNLDLKSYLIKPVQRICKYPLLLRELQKCYQSLSEGDSDDVPPSGALLERLEEARLMMGEILESTNDQMVISDGRAVLTKFEETLNRHAADEGSKIRLAAPSKRQFIFQDVLLAGIRSGKKKDKAARRTFVLTTDCVLVAAAADNDEHVLRAALPLSSLQVTDIGDGAAPDIYGGDAVNILELASPEVLGETTRLVIYASTAAVKEKWVRGLGVGVRLQQRLDALATCTLCGQTLENGAALKTHAASCKPVVVEVAPDEVVRWLRADPDRKKALELSKRVDQLNASDRAQWDSLREMARSEKRKTLQHASFVPPEPVRRSATGKISIPVKSHRRKSGQTKPVSVAPEQHSPRRQTTAGVSPSKPNVLSESTDEPFFVYSASVSPRSEKKK